jgi:hypothetical protein
MTDAEKLTVVVNELTANADGFDSWPWEWVGDTLAIASLDYDNRVQLDLHMRSDLVAWVGRAEARVAAGGQADDEEFAFSAAVYETRWTQ